MYSTAQPLQVKDLPPSCGTNWMFQNLRYTHAVQRLKRLERLEIPAPLMFVGLLHTAFDA